MNAADRFASLKLILSRLNGEWSPTADTFSHQADASLRQAVWSETNIWGALAHLWTARIYMERAWADMIDSTQMAPHEIRDSNVLRRWSETLEATISFFDELESYVSRDEKDMLAKHITSFYNKLF